jgi:hypothetical protein
MIKYFLPKIKNFIKLLFGKKYHTTQKKNITPQASINESDNSLSVKVETSSPHPYGQHSNGYPEPPTTGIVGTITSFLWKPQSDHGEHAVVLVSCDEVPTNQLFMEIKNNNGNIIQSENIKAFSRGNKLSEQKFARISFRINTPMKNLKKAAPLQLRFFQVINEQKYFLPIRGQSRKAIQIVDPQKRIEWQRAV